MKLSITLLSLVAMVIAVPHRLVTRSLQSDLMEFFDYYNSEEVIGIIMSYVNCDEEFRAYVEFTQSEEFGEFIEKLRTFPEYNELLGFFGDVITGDSNDEASTAALDLGSSRFKRSAESASPNCDQPISGGFRGFYRDIFAALPLEQLKALLGEKLETSPEFRAFFAKLRSEEFRSIIQRLKANPNFQQLLSETKVDIDGLINGYQSAFGVQY